ncbi:MAG: DUF167 domain-containing protein [Anaerolineae bacterium]|jgi:hypothetical protein
MVLRISEENGGCTFRVRVAPKGRRNEIIGEHGDAIKVRVQAPPVEGKANEALREFLAEQLGVSCRDVEIVSGHTSRWKRVKVDGVTPDAIESLLSGTR